jgi:Arm DNA-binding domain
MVVGYASSSHRPVQSCGRWRYRFDGKEKMMALGEYPLVSLKEARERHFEARKTLAAGVDPMAERKAEASPSKPQSPDEPDPELRWASCSVPSSVHVEVSLIGGVERKKGIAILRRPTEIRTPRWIEDRRRCRYYRVSC